MKSNIAILVGVLLLALAACGPTQNTIAPVEEWPAIGTQEAAESTRVALEPTVAAAGRVAVPVIAENPQDALRQMKAVLANYATYAAVDITVVSGKSIVLTATYEASRSRGIVWSGEWTPTVYVMRGTSTSWTGDDRFWGDTP